MIESTEIQLQPSPTDIRQLPGLLHGRDDIHGHIEGLLDPIALVSSLWITAFAFDRSPGSAYLILSLVLVLLTYPGRSRLHLSLGRLFSDLVMLGITLIGLLVFLGWATHHLELFPERAIVNWTWIAPVCLLGAHLAFRYAAPLVLRNHRCVIVGMNDQGLALARRIEQNPYTDLSLVGFFDDRVAMRLTPDAAYPLLGRFDDLAGYARAHQVNVIYLSVPMSTQERTLKLLDDLRDTTASIYFVPDQFVTELIQGRMSSVVDIPVVAVCETPFVGINAILKRSSDVLISAVATRAHRAHPAGDRPARSSGFTGCGHLQAASLRTRRQGDHHLQVPVDAGSPRTVRRSGRPSATTSGSRHWARSCARRRWTNCRSSSTCSRVA